MVVAVQPSTNNERHHLTQSCENTLEMTSVHDSHWPENKSELLRKREITQNKPEFNRILFFQIHFISVSHPEGEPKQYNYTVVVRRLLFD